MSRFRLPMWVAHPVAKDEDKTTYEVTRVQDVPNLPEAPKREGTMIIYRRTPNA